MAAIYPDEIGLVSMNGRPSGRCGLSGQRGQPACSYTWPPAMAVPAGAADVASPPIPVEHSSSLVFTQTCGIGLLGFAPTPKQKHFTYNRVQCCQIPQLHGFFKR